MSQSHKHNSIPKSTTDSPTPPKQNVCDLVKLCEQHNSLWYTTFHCIHIGNEINYKSIVCNSINHNNTCTQEYPNRTRTAAHIFAKYRFVICLYLITQNVQLLLDKPKNQKQNERVEIHTSYVDYKTSSTNLNWHGLWNWSVFSCVCVCKSVWSIYTIFSKINKFLPIPINSNQI